MMGAGGEKIARAMFTQQFYHASGFKANWGFKDNWPDPEWQGLSLDVMRKLRPRIIFLTRENKLKQAISALYLKAGKCAHPGFSVHSLNGDRPAFQTKIDPQAALGWRNRFAKTEKVARRTIKAEGLDYLEITYEQMTGGQHVDCIVAEVAEGLCEFLSVDDHPLCAGLKKLAPPDISDIVTNWAEIRKAARNKGKQ
ncbi:MAG: hypothetical protein R6X31_13845 [Anaerolineae bacterium]